MLEIDGVRALLIDQFLLLKTSISGIAIQSTLWAICHNDDIVNDCSAAFRITLTFSTAFDWLLYMYFPTRCRPAWH